MSDEDKASAQTLLERGNEAFLSSDYKPALGFYRQAARHWNHPAIHFNIAKTLVSLDRPLEAYESLLLALAYGKAPLEDQTYQDALSYRRLLEGQIGSLEVSCSQAGVDVSLDGSPVLSCPGKREQRVMPGSHQVVGKKDGFITSTREVVVGAGATEKVDVRLLTFEEASTTERRWNVWLPWTVVGAGAALAGGGVLLRRRAQWNYRRADDRFDADCPTGCFEGQEPRAVRDIEERARLQERLSVAAFISGGVAFATGVALVWVNRERVVLGDELPATVGPSAGDGIEARVRWKF